MERTRNPGSVNLIGALQKDKTHVDFWADLTRLAVAMFARCAKS